MKWLDVLILLAFGITLHDIASIEGIHINGLHAIYFSIPMMGILIGIKFERWVTKWWRFHKVK